MNKRLIFIGIAACLMFCSGVSFAKEAPGDRQNDGFSKTGVQDGTTQTVSNLSRWEYWIRRDGQSGHDPAGNDGGYYPAGTANVIYQDGLIWAGVVRDTRNPSLPRVRAGGQTYRVGTTQGHIVTAGTATSAPVAADANTAYMYRIRRDWATLQVGQATVINDAASVAQISASSVSDAAQQQLIDDYQRDWENWPVELGAPYYDVNQNGVYDFGYEEDLDGNGEIGLGEREEPGIAGADQVIWFVVNDLDEGRTTNLAGAQPIGLEMQATIWAYNQPGSTLGQLIFKQYRLINKSGFRIDSMFVAQWSDPDVGVAVDDLVGCDIERSLGFAYTGSLTDSDFDDFNLPPAAGGYDFFQGPLVEGRAGQDLNNNGIDDASDYGLFNLKQVGPGKINLPLTSFGYFAAGSTIDDPDWGEYDGTLQIYNLLNGFTTTADTANPSPFVAGFGEDAGQATKFPVSGDPVGQTGDIDAFGSNLAAGDRRMSLSSGPFTMLPGDTQEVVVAVVGGIVEQEGGNNRNAVAQLKLNDDFAQFIFNKRFEGIPSPPATPDVQVTALENQVALEWGSNLNRVRQTEAKDPLLGFDFEGYNIYQLPSASAAKAQAVRIATYDLSNTISQINANKFVPEFGDIVSVPIQKGLNTGVQRYFVIEKDYIRDQPLYAGNTYYFAVTAYNAKDEDGDGIVDSDVPESSLESAFEVITVVPQSTGPGVRYEGEVMDVLEVQHPSGSSDGVVQARVVNPVALTGDDYEVSFAADTDTASATFGELLWTLTNATTGQVVIANQPQALSVDAPDISRPIVDGLEFIITGPALDFKSFQNVANGNGPFDDPLPGALNFAGFPTPESSDPAVGQQADGEGRWAIHTADNGSRGDYDSFISRTTRDGGNWPDIIPYDFEMRFTERGSWTWDAFETGGFFAVPFELWNIGVNTPDDPSDDYRMLPVVLDDDHDGTFNLCPPGSRFNGSDEHSASSLANDPYTDWVYWYNPTTNTAAEPPGEAAYLAIEDSLRDGSFTGFTGSEVLARIVLVNWNGGEQPPYNQDMPEQGTVFRIISSKPNTTADVFRISAPAVVQDNEIAKSDVEKINVFPNPYYAYNPEEPNRFTRFVTFTHLPERVTIRLFTISGIQVRKLSEGDKQTLDSQFLRWDLKNEAGLPVASGVYIAHISMPDLGKEKVVKLFVIQGEEILEYF